MPYAGFARARMKTAYHASRRFLANIWLNVLHRSTKQIAITGSYAKTSTSYAISQVLSRFAPTLTTDLDLDTIFNVPITALRLRRHPFIVFELGIDSPNEMAFHLELVRPQIAVMTGITPVHSDEKHLGSLQALIREKRRLLEALPPDGTAILHYDDHRVRAMAAHTAAQVRWYGTQTACHYRAEDVLVRVSGSRFRAVTPTQAFEVDTPLLGMHNCTNLMAAVAVGEQLGVPPETMRKAFAELQPLRGRLNIEPGPRGTILVNDALRANPASTRAGLEFMRQLATTSRKIAVLGEMGELGDHAVSEHTEIGRVAAGSGLDLLVCVGGLTRHTAEAASVGGMSPGQVLSVPGVHQAAEWLEGYLRPGDILYLKGSLLRHMERIRLLLDRETVGCAVGSCPFYHQCTDCRFREKGYVA